MWFSDSVTSGREKRWTLPGLPLLLGIHFPGSVQAVPEGCQAPLEALQGSLWHSCNSAKARVHGVCVSLVNKFTAFQLSPRLNECLIITSCKADREEC